MTEDRGAAGPYVAHVGLPVLHGREQQLPLAHPYGPLDAQWRMGRGEGVGSGDERCALLLRGAW
ncbi:DUF6420 family protein [Streptomyces sp. NBC_00566]|nr:DUF6420 family protein [Streptomyces sp. NBC_00566]